jgi:hypothetical protein
VANEVMDVSDYWDGNALDSSKAFTLKEHVLIHIRSLLLQLPAKFKKFRKDADSIYNSILGDRFSRIGKSVKVDGWPPGVIFAVLPGDKFLVVTEELHERRDRTRIRHGFVASPDMDAVTEQKDITYYWRKDNEIRRRDRCFISEVGAISWIRRKIFGIRRSGVPEKHDKILREIKNTGDILEFDLLSLIGREIVSNNRGEEATRGPLPVSGKLVALVSGGQGLVLVSKSSAGKQGTLVGRKRLIEIHSQVQESTP